MRPAYLRRTAPAAALALAACAAPGADPPSASAIVEAAPATPGAHRILAPDEIVATENCRSRRSGYWRLDGLELDPAVVQAGGALTQRLVTVMCPRRSGATVHGRLRTTISRGREVIYSDLSAFAIAPGRWTTVAIVMIPGDATPGLHHLSVDFDAGRAGSFARTADFTVRPNLIAQAQ